METARKHGRRYPWREWFRKGRVVLSRGVHFDCRPDVFVQMVFRAAATMRRQTGGWPRKGSIGATVLPCETKVELTCHG